MTTVQVLSDLHFNQHGFLDRHPPEVSTKADILVLAGDILDGSFFTRSSEVFEQWYASIDIPIVFVLGNHEYDNLRYVSNVKQAYSTWLGQLNRNTMVLENGKVTLGGVTFLGTTLFTNLSPVQEAGVASFFGHLPLPTDFTGYWWVEKFKAAKRFLVKELRDLTETQRNFTVVVSHFAPTWGSVAEEHLGNATNCYFAANLDGLLERYWTKYWIHGHTHTPTTYQVGNTSVVCNPYGYIYQDGRREASTKHFNPQLLLEI